MKECKFCGECFEGSGVLCPLCQEIHDSHLGKHLTELEAVNIRLHTALDEACRVLSSELGCPSGVVCENPTDPNCDACWNSYCYRVATGTVKCLEDNDSQKLRERIAYLEAQNSRLKKRVDEVEKEYLDQCCETV